jgi:hypothetical protein
LTYYLACNYLELENSILGYHFNALKAGNTVVHGSFTTNFIRDQVPFTVPSDLIDVIWTKFSECKNISFNDHKLLETVERKVSTWEKFADG